MIHSEVALILFYFCSLVVICWAALSVYLSTAAIFFIFKGFYKVLKGDIDFQQAFSNFIKDFRRVLSNIFSIKNNFDYKAKILIIDDDEIFTSIIESYLKDYKCSYKSVNNGSDALNLINRKTDFDLILIDWNMPGLSGSQTLIEANKKLLHLDGELRTSFATISGASMQQETLPKVNRLKYEGHINKSSISRMFHQIKHLAHLKA